MASVREYIGARYVPVFAEPVEWDDDRAYEPLTMVQHVGETYMSRQAVPIGAQLPDTSQGEESNQYWVYMSNWNAQVESYRQEVLAYNSRISTLENDLPIVDFDSENTVSDAIAAISALLPGSEFDSDNTVKDYIDGKDLVHAMMFDTVADMKASTALSRGITCMTKGFRTVGDGGGAWYRIVSSGTANELDVIACGDLLAEYVFTGQCNFEQFGAYGNGVNDDHDAIETAFSYKNVKPLVKEYATTGLVIETAENLAIDFNGCTFLKTGDMEYALFNISPLADNLIITARNGVFNCNHQANYGFIVRHAKDNADIDYNSIINIENLEVSNTDNEAADIVYASVGISVYTGTKVLNVSNCHVHDIYRTADNEGVIGSRCIGINNVRGSVNISNNTLENVYRGVNTYDSDALQIYENASDASEVSVLIENNVFKNSFTRFIKLQCRNVTVKENKFLNTWANVDLRAPVDFQTACGDFIDNVIEYTNTPNSVGVVDFVKMRSTINGNTANVSGNKFVSSLEVYRYFLYIYSTNADNIELELNVEDNNLPLANSFVRYDVRGITGAFKNVFINLMNNVINCTGGTFLYLDEVTQWKSTDALKKTFIKAIGNLNMSSINLDMFASTYINALGNVFIDKNRNLNNSITSTNFDVGKIDSAKVYFSTDGTSSGGIIGSPDGNAHRYQLIEVERYGNFNIMKYMSGPTPTPGQVTVDSATTVART